MKVLRCYAVGGEEGWEGVCLDFCLAVQGGSFEDVEQKLRASIADYLEYVEGLPVEERQAFLKRRAPMSQRLEFYSIVLAHTFRGNDRGDHHGDRERMPLFCHA